MISNKETDNVSYYQAELKKKLVDLNKLLKSEVESTINKQFESWSDHLSTNNNKTVNSLPVERKFQKISTSHKSYTEKKIPSKVFIARPSLLTELFVVDHIKGIYNMFLATLCIMFIHEILEESIRTGSVSMDLSMVHYSFGKLDEVIRLSLYMELFTIVFVYTSFYFWSKWRWTAPAVFDVSGLCIYVTYLSMFLHLPVQTLIRCELPPTSSFIILCEQARLIMKTWAFVRYNIARVRNHKSNDYNVSPCPGFSNYLYFIFAPTLIYRDDYPRNSTCNWKQVLKNFTHVAACILFANFLFAKLFSVVKQLGKQDFSMSQLIVVILSCSFPAALLFLLGFFLLLHSWQNAFAEMLCFADRMFYKDWWNSTSFSMFYRTWNCIVHDWLYEYVYKEICDLLTFFGVSFRTGRYLAMLAVFFISAVVHEYILAFSLGFFYPVLFFMFGGFGTLLMFMNPKSAKFNIFFWFSLILGYGILVCLYYLEWHARFHCPKITNDLTDFFIPRSWFCRSFGS